MLFIVSIPSQRNLLMENRKTDKQVLYTQDKNVHDTFEGYFKDLNQLQSESKSSSTTMTI